MDNSKIILSILKGKIVFEIRLNWIDERLSNCSYNLTRFEMFVVCLKTNVKYCALIQRLEAKSNRLWDWKRLKFKRKSLFRKRRKTPNDYCARWMSDICTKNVCVNRNAVDFHKFFVGLYNIIRNFQWSCWYWISDPWIKLWLIKTIFKNHQSRFWGTSSGLPHKTHFPRPNSRETIRTIQAKTIFSVSILTRAYFWVNRKIVV